MILNYHARMAGPYHLDKGIPCQDNFYVKNGRDGFVIAAVADGLGSEAHSDIGSDIASRVAVDFCAENIHRGSTDIEIRKIMNNAFVYAYKAVLIQAAADGNSEDEYDTTLCLAAYDGEHLWYGQAGDSGMVALLKSGDYVQVTTQQRDEDGYVFPLCFGPEKWVFGRLEEEVSSVMLMTDGVFEQICPPLMRKKPVTVNVSLARKFMAHNSRTEEDMPALEAVVSRYLEHYPRRLLDDDKTVVVLMNNEHTPAEKEESYYAEPDWKALQAEALANLYPDRTTEPVEPAEEPEKEPIVPVEPEEEPEKEPIVPVEPEEEPEKESVIPAGPAEEPEKEPAVPAGPAEELEKEPAVPAGPAEAEKEPEKEPAVSAEPSAPVHPAGPAPSAGQVKAPEKEAEMPHASAEDPQVTGKEPEAETASDPFAPDDEEGGAEASGPDPPAGEGQKEQHGAENSFKLSPADMFCRVVTAAALIGLFLWLLYRAFPLQTAADSLCTVFYIMY